MSAITSCKECGSKDLRWDTHNRIQTDVQQGRLNTSDVICLFVLGCNECGETLGMKDADKVAEGMNAQLRQLVQIEAALASNAAMLRELAVKVPTPSRELTPEALFKYASDFARLSERTNQGTVYPTIKACAQHFGTTQRAIEEAANDYSGPDYLGLIVAYRAGNRVGNLKGGARQIEAYKGGA